MKKIIVLFAAFFALAAPAASFAMDHDHGSMEGMDMHEGHHGEAAHEQGDMNMHDMDMKGMDMHDMDMKGAGHGSMHNHADADCTKDCQMLLKSCAQEADTLQQRIRTLKSAIEKDGADQAKVEELKALHAKLREANETLRSLNKPGR